MPPRSKDLLRPFLENRFYFGGELIAERSVDQPVIEGEREKGLGANCNGVVDHNGDLLDRADSKDGHLRLVDYRCCEDAAEASEVCDGEGAGLHFIGLELAR